MAEKRILGLDLGTNSIGWALVEIDNENGIVKILGLGSRILPMDAGEIKDFESSGKVVSMAAQRTEKRGARRLLERYLLRRDRLHLVLNLLDALPKHYRLDIDFENKKGEKSGQIKVNKEPKLAYLPKETGRKSKFLFMDSYKEMIKDVNSENVKNEKGKRIPYDWTLYYLRKKALTDKISLEELAWVLLSYNQKRGYEKTDSIDEFDDLPEKLKEFGLTKSIQEVIDTRRIEIEPLILKVVEVSKSKNKFGVYFNIVLENGYSYKEYSTEQITELNDKIDEVKIVERFTILNEEGTDIDETKTIYKIEDIFELNVGSIVPKDTKDKYLKEYSNGWKVDTNYSDFNKFQKSKNEIKEDIFLTRLYNNRGDLIKPSKKSESLNLNISNDPFSEFKLLDPNKASNWKLLKKKTEKEALQFNSLNGYVDEKNNVKNYISPKIYNILKEDAKSKTGSRTKIIGGMFQVVDRDFYREELNQVIATQKQFHTNLKDKETFEQCVKTLYPENKNHQNSLLNNKDAIQHLLVEDILLYQRPLKSKKSEIANCKYEIRYWKDVVDKNGNPIKEVDIETGELKVKKEPVYIKVASASHPYYQEFRIWDKLHNLRLIQFEKVVDGKSLTNQDVTKEFFKSDRDYQELFEELNNRKTLNQNQFLSYCKEKFKIDYKPKDSNYAWNFPEDEEIKGNETRVSFATRFKRFGFTEYADFLTQEKEVDLWHYLYSVSCKERTENDNKSTTTFFNNYFEGFDIDEEVKEKIIENFAKYPKFASKYGAYSEKALKKLLPLIRLGELAQEDSWENENWYRNWQESLMIRKDEILQKLNEINFDAENIDYSDAINTSVDLQNREIPFPKGLFNVFRDVELIEDFNHLNLTQASYLVYGRHSELAFAKQWETPKQIREELHQELKQHSLNNPVAEKVLLEMMQVVADIWDYYGDGKEKFFSKIHLEVGRELKKSAKEKESDSKRMSGNKAQNKRIRQILEEYLANNSYNANPRNSDHFERLKIAEEGAEHTKNNDKEFFNDKSYSKKDIEEILKKPHITKEDFEKYKLWIEQGYRSPYSGQMIKITELFDGTKYNIDHIFPQASITNNSLSNKVVVEVALNKLKSDKTARAFIQSQNGQSYLGIPVCSEDEYVNIVKTQFSRTKRLILLSKEIPKGFTNSQMNNTRHIARKAMELLSHIVREPGEVEFRSKNVLPVTGRITTELKRAWKLDEVWTELVAPRFIRMNELTQSNLFGSWQTSKNGQKFFDCNLDQVIREKDDSYDIKRIDHRHHALDALIVALCTENHVNYINNINANAKSENYGKQKQIEKYRQTLKRKIKFTKKENEQDENNWYYMLPGESRKVDAENSRRDSVLEMVYHYKEDNSFHGDYKKMILTALQGVITSTKNSKFPIRKTSNRYWSYKNEQGRLNQIKGNNVKKLIKQIDKNNTFINNENNRNIAIRKGMHDEIPYGEKWFNFELKDLVKNLKYRNGLVDEELKIRVEDLYYNCKEDLTELAKRIKLDKAYPSKAFFNIKEPLRKYTTRKSLVGLSLKQIDKIADPLIYKDLQIHIKEYADFEDALSASGVEHFNKNRRLPVNKVTLVESGSGRYTLGDIGIKPRQNKMVEGKTFCFLINKVEKDYQTISLREIIVDYIKGKKVQDFVFSDDINKTYLFPGDLVYFATDENEDILIPQNIYQFINSSGVTANFAPVNFATTIWDYDFPSKNNKEEKEFNKLLTEIYDFNMPNSKPLKNELGLGSKQNKNTKEIIFVSGESQSKEELLKSEQIKENCIKIKIDRLGNVLRS